MVKYGLNLELGIYNDWASTPPNYYSIDEWLYLSAVFKNSNYIKLYVNGDLVDQVSTDRIFNMTNDQDLFLGKIGYSNAEYFNGNIDEVSIWDKELTQEEIQGNMYRAIEPIQEPNLKGYWRMEKGSGFQVIDLTSNHNHGIIEDVFSEPISYIWSNEAIEFVPIVTLSTESDLITNSNTIQVDVHFTTPVSGFTQDDVVVNNANLSSFSG